MNIRSLLETDENKYRMIIARRTNSITFCALIAEAVRAKAEVFI